MRIEVTECGVTLHREKGDKAFSHESEVTHHLRRLLRLSTGRPFVRFYPDREGLTGCRQGVCDRRGGVCYWHARYAVEAAHRAFNGGSVFYARG